ncbi:MAG: formate--tetrahydrofolate ligase, partial [Firmicutes bacterium]|nr:formate--tetrahydrofolate ligase [Bacillota bacterium]
MTTAGTTAQAVPSDLEIAQKAKMLPVTEIAKNMGIEEDDLELYGRYKAKVNLELISKLKSKPNGK